MHFPTPRFLVLFCVLMAPGLAAPGILAIDGDPHRWSKPDVYVCLAAAAYALGWLVAYMGSPAFRHFIATGQNWWQSIVLNPAILVLVSLHWARHHDPVFLVVIPGLIGWIAWRKAKVTRASGASAIGRRG